MYVCSNKTRLFVHRSTAGVSGAGSRDGSRDHRPSGPVLSVSPRSDASSPPPSVVVPPPSRQPAGGHLVGGAAAADDDDVEDLILDNESRRTVINNTRGIAQLAASRRASRQPRPLPSSYVTLSVSL